MVKALRNLWFGLMLISLILVLIYAGMLIFSQSLDIYGVEMNVVYSLQRLIDGEALYTHPEYPPYNVVQYMPAYYAVVHVLSRILAIEADNVYGIYVLARMVSAAFAVGIYLLVWRLCLDFGLKGLALLTSLVFAILAPMPWYLVVRPDSMVAFFNLLAVYLFIRYLQNEKQKNLMLLGAGVALAFGFYSKQTAVLFMAILLAFPFYHQWLKDRFMLGLGIVLGLLAAALLFLPYANPWPSAENVFYLNVLGGVTNSPDLDRAIWVYRIYFIIFFAFFFLPLLVTVMNFWQLAKDARWKPLPFWQALRKLNPGFAFLLFAFWGNTAMAIAMSLKAASAINYFNESMILAVLLLAYFMNHPSIAEGWRKSTRLVLGIGFALFLSLVTIGRFNTLYYFASLFVVSQEAQFEEVVAILDEAFSAQPDKYFIFYPGNAWNRALHLYSFENALFEPVEVYNVSYFDLSSLETYLEDGTVLLLVMEKAGNPNWVFLGYENLQDYFEPWRETENHLVYRNRNSD